jgi:hypothetical protein
MVRYVRIGAFAVAVWAICAAAHAQDQPQMQMNMPDSDGWMFMQDGIVFAEFDRQGGPRGGNEFVAPNWWMGMASRETSHGRLTFNAMISLDPATVGKRGYGELFQTGEAINGQPLIDRQHPHDLFMQLAAVWRTPLTDSTSLTFAGGPVGEPALGPVVYMHRASAMDNPMAPLGHHTFDSTHVAFGVVTAAVNRGPWLLEGSLFNGREPDENRWDFDFGKLDSFSGRLWYLPNDEWMIQVSSGHLTSPEELEPGNTVRSTASASWTRIDGSTISAVTVGYGRNDTDHGSRNAFLAEGAHHANGNTIYTRFEALQVEIEGRNTVASFTLGAVHDVLTWKSFEGGVGAGITLYGVPDTLQSVYSSHPVSFQVFFRLRPPAGPMGRMWNMIMSQPMGAMSTDMSMHHHGSP